MILAIWEEQKIRKMSRVLFIIPYLIMDDKTEYDYPQNVKIEYSTFQELRTKSENIMFHIYVEKFAE